MARHRKLRGGRLKKQRQIIIISLICLTFLIGTGYAAFSTNITLTAKGNITKEETCTLNHEWTYDYEDNKIYDLTIPCNAIYKLETWGAQGGDALTLEGGYGDYSLGTINLKRKDKLYIVVGGKGEGVKDLETFTTEYYKITKGGYNGGGNGHSGVCSNGGKYRYGSSGGGATHIALSSGLLNTFENKLNDLLIVSGGGGGAFTFGTFNYGAFGSGAHAGGYIGNTAYYTLVSHTKEQYATGGTQASGGVGGNSYSDSLPQAGSFGKGGSLVYGAACTNGSGGGSGYYGGGSGNFAPGAGGSSYINNDNLKNKQMTCFNCTQATTDGIKTISTDKANEKPIEYTAKKGNGYAKITLISRN